MASSNEMDLMVEQLDGLVNGTEELSKDQYSKVLKMIETAMEAEKISEGISLMAEDARKAAMEQQKAMLDELTESLDQVMEMPFALADVNAKNLMEQFLPEEVEHLGDYVDKVGTVIGSGMDNINFEEVQKHLPKERAQDLQANMNQVPSIINEFVNHMPSMVRHDRKNLIKSSTGIGIAAVGLCVLGASAAIANPVGMAILGALAVGFGVKLAIGALKDHKMKMNKLKEEEGVDARTTAEMIDDTFDYTADLAQSVLDSGAKSVGLSFGSEEHANALKKEGKAKIKAGADQLRHVATKALRNT